MSDQDEALKSELSKIETGDQSFILLVGNDIIKEDIVVAEAFILKHIKDEKDEWWSV